MQAWTLFLFQPSRGEDKEKAGCWNETYPRLPHWPSVFPLQCVSGLASPGWLWIRVKAADSLTVKLLSTLKMKQRCMRWTICRQKCVENCLTRQTVWFQLGIKQYLNSGVTRIIPLAANYRNGFLRHAAAPGMIIWPTTAHRTHSSDATPIAAPRQQQEEGEELKRARSRVITKIQLCLSRLFPPF